MSNEGEGGHEEDEDGGAVLRVPVDLARHSHEPEQSGSLEQADERRRLKKGTKNLTKFSVCLFSLVV